ncbi:MAG: ABC transporter permease [Peptostreptococcaceae bacterium]|nr:ABC transporter permease [Peptostreptococcaceae bacterium]
MWKTVLRRVLIMIPQLFVLSILVFALGRAMPGDPFTGLITPETEASRIEELREKAGLNDPLRVQYVNWLKRISKGDLGMSYNYKRPVSDVIGERAKNTFYLSLLSTILLYAIAIPLGVLAGRYYNSLFDRCVVFYNFLSYAMPSYVLYLVMLLVFGYRLAWFPTSGTVGLGVAPGLPYIMSRLQHMILPAFTYALLATTSTIQYLRNEVVDAKTMDYVRTARSKGVPISKVYTHHIFRNSLLPIAAFFGFTITGLLGGSIILETIFAYPGMGELFISAMGSRDYSIITALIMLYGFLILTGSVLSDIIMSIVDPRIRIE